MRWALETSPAPVSHPAPHRQVPTTTYTNPVIAGDFPDPDVVLTGSGFVAVATGVGGTNVPIETSTDLARWKAHGDALPVLPTWAVPSSKYVWAPDLSHVGKEWVLWFVARDAATGRQCIGDATATTATGPFHAISDQPAVCQVALGGSIDPDAFVDARGNRWLLWKNDGNCCNLLSRIWSQPLATDGTTLVGSATPILSYGGGWESGGPSTLSTIEAPEMVEVSGIFHLFYSGGGYATSGYAVGHAVCSSPGGPCQSTSPFPVLSSFGSVAGPGGESIFTDRRGAYWIAYAAWTAPNIGYANGGVRSMRIDRLSFFGALPVIDGPTTTPVSVDPLR
jgi:beta-xylosidase